MGVQTEELYKKCKESTASGDIMSACKVMLEQMEARKVEVEKEERSDLP